MQSPRNGIIACFLPLSLATSFGSLSIFLFFCSIINLLYINYDTVRKKVSYYQKGIAFWVIHRKVSSYKKLYFFNKLIIYPSRMALWRHDWLVMGSNPLCSIWTTSTHSGSLSNQWEIVLSCFIGMQIGTDYIITKFCWPGWGPGVSNY